MKQRSQEEKIVGILQAHGMDEMLQGLVVARKSGRLKDLSVAFLTAERERIRR